MKHAFKATKFLRRHILVVGLSERGEGIGQHIVYVFDKDVLILDH